MVFQLVKYKNKWAIFDTQSKVYYFGKKQDLLKRITILNKGA